MQFLKQPGSAGKVAFGLGRGAALKSALPACIPHPVRRRMGRGTRVSLYLVSGDHVPPPWRHVPLHCFRMMCLAMASNLGQQVLEEAISTRFPGMPPPIPSVGRRDCHRVKSEAGFIVLGTFLPTHVLRCRYLLLSSR